MKDLLVLFGIAVLFVGLFFAAIQLRPSVDTTTSSIEVIDTGSDTNDSLLPFLGSFPQIEGIDDWINSGPLTTEDLKGKVVLVDFWTYSCINCIRTLPYITDWWDKYEDDGLVILGVHAPEFGFEKIYENVVATAKQHGITYPIAQHNNFTTWRNFENRFWPAKYLFDQEGNLRYYHYGEGSYDKTEAAIQELLAVSKDMTEITQQDRSQVNSPETYFGYWRSENFKSPEGITKDTATTFTLPAELDLNEWALEGEWSIQYQHAQALQAGARFQFRYSAGVANLVMAIDGGKLQDIVVYLDGKEVDQEMLGAHIVKDELTGSTFTQVEFSDLYELISGTPGEHLLEIETLQPGLQIYAITFG